MTTFTVCNSYVYTQTCAFFGLFKINIILKFKLSRMNYVYLIFLTSTILCFDHSFNVYQQFFF